MQACMEQPGDNLGPFSAPTCALLSSRSHTTTGVEPAVVLAGQDHTITREVICQDSAGFIHGADMKWMRSAVFGEDTPSPVRVITRLFTAGGEEKEDSDDAGTSQDASRAQKVYVRSQIASGLLGDLDGVKKKELYNKVNVKERKDSVAVELSYPSERYQITKSRGQVLYYIAGWAASKAWTHKRRHNLSQDWVRVVQHNTRRSSGEAICTDSMLRFCCKSRFEER
ncbi:unnamed protein product [Ectocarpus sp. CCAP 1310/34]|nr:unnamed protein product [Ectocarpus sp. CCAP 1310/34]